jgi:thermostable 8-oxoguanine DNA glycosylase
MDFHKEIDPQGKPIQFDRTEDGMEAWFIFCIMVAGKGASQTRKQVEKLLTPAIEKKLSPFNYFLLCRHQDGNLETTLKRFKTGQYTKLAKAFMRVARHWSVRMLLTCSIEDLESIHGVGMKTARFFMLSTRYNARCAALDTHLLKRLREPDAAHFLLKEGLTGESVPKATPPRKLYLKLERVVLAMADHFSQTPAEFDYESWVRYYKGA